MPTIPRRDGEEGCVLEISASTGNIEVGVQSANAAHLLRPRRSALNLGQGRQAPPIANDAHAPSSRTAMRMCVLSSIIWVLLFSALGTVLPTVDVSLAHPRGVKEALIDMARRAQWL